MITNSQKTGQFKTLQDLHNYLFHSFLSPLSHLKH
uniref:Uncharacterized protein n=1 Tax=Lepeophtheirus salmonis TaxID=72036 RepID=A0A0K2UA60_LEPSM